MYFQLIGLLLEDRLIDGLCCDVFMVSCIMVYIQLFEVVNFKVICNKIGSS